ncbi:MAG: hypothetical protein OWQ54_09335 [Sulfolobaceae archaeon]|nr:hypothetical protein [Sulfolobaceae archaeon]
MYTKTTVTLTLIILLLLLPSYLLSIPTHSSGGIIYGPTNYGYEFGYVKMNGIMSIITMYNLSVAISSPMISIQQNICLNVNGENVFVQNVIQPLTVNKSIWITSVYYNGYYNTTSFSYLIGSEINLTTIWTPEGNTTIITFYASNGTLTFDKTYTLKGRFIGVIYDGYIIGTVVGGYGNGATAYLAKGFNISIVSFYEYNGSWYVPPVAYSGYPNTGENAFNGTAYYYDGKVWVVYGNSSGPQLLYNFSVVVVNNTVYTFPPNSLWVLNNGRESFFVNKTSFENGAELSPFMIINHTFVLEKKIELVFPQPVEIDGVRSKVFYLPSPEAVYIDEGGKLVAEYINSSSYSVIVNSSSTTTSSSVSLSWSIIIIIAVVVIALLLPFVIRYVKRRQG